MFTAETGEVDSIGTTFLSFNLDNMIERDYQFTEETSGHAGSPPVAAIIEPVV
jgi:hypothetical protein